ncbi:MAG TPA: hypothetical protein DCP68_04270, partial [Ruminococcus sp.]|nr:hypothetical protein [Ruminococcus sp.]
MPYIAYLSIPLRTQNRPCRNMTYIMITESGDFVKLFYHIRKKTAFCTAFNNIFRQFIQCHSAANRLLPSRNRFPPWLSIATSSGKSETVSRLTDSHP